MPVQEVALAVAKRSKPRVVNTPAARCHALLAEVRGCQHCAMHLPLALGPMLQIDPRARLLIAGQAPGRRVHDSGVPFEDASGWECMASVPGVRLFSCQVVQASQQPRAAYLNNLTRK